MKLIKKNFYLVLLLITVAFSLFLRTISLDNIPLGFHIDEASLGYNAYSLLSTGKDSDGVQTPLYINMFDDNNPSGYYYLAAISIKFFGLNEFAVRLPAALFGALSVIAVYLLSFEIFKSKRTALAAGLFTGIAPWNLVLSRTSSESLVSLFFVVLGFALLLAFFRKNKNWYLIFGIANLIISYLLYPAPRLFVPLFLVAFIVFYLIYLPDKVMKNKIPVTLSFIAICFTSIILIFMTSGGSSRFNQVSIFNFPETKLNMEERIREDGIFNTNVFITRMFHNKPVEYSFTFMSNYFKYFSGQFLFVEGGLPALLRVPNVGLIYLIELPFFLWGFVSIFKDKRLNGLPILIWLFIAPVASSITFDDSPNVRRASIMFPAIEILAAFGFMQALAVIRKSRLKILVGVVLLLFIFNFSYFMHQYFIHAQINKNWYRNEGFSEMVGIINKDYNIYDRIIVTKSLGGIYPFILFYSKYDPRTYQLEGSPKDKNNKGFGKFFFTDSSCPSIDRDPAFPAGKIIYVDNGNCREYEGLKSHDYSYVTRKDNSKVFRIVYD